MLKHALRLEELRNKSLAVDASNFLYQFLALIRMRSGMLLHDSHGNVTSHLVGLMFRSTRLLYEYGINLVFVFDGKSPELKKQEITGRRQIREKAIREWKKALEAGDYPTAFSKSVMTSRLTKPMVEDAKRLLKLLGIPFVQAPSEAEAQAAYMASRGDIWGVSSKDYDSLLFGAPRLVRFLTLTGKKFLPSKGVFRRLKPELIYLQEFLSHYKISREQFIDLAILVGTDFNQGVKGVGPKSALTLLKKHGKLENLPTEIQSKLPRTFKKIRKIFLQPPTTSDYTIEYGELREEILYDFLCGQRDFSRESVKIVVKRMKTFYSKSKQMTLEGWGRMS
jgi:flap endonuclease-1